MELDNASFLKNFVVYSEYMINWIIRHAYRKALAAIRGLPYRVEDADQVKNVSGIGDKIRKKINEILTTGKLKKADEVSVYYCCRLSKNFYFYRRVKNRKH